METFVYEQFTYNESKHWWFVGRRKILSAVMRQAQLPPQADVLDAGCCSGGNLEFLSSYGKVFAFEMNGEVREMAKARNIGVVEEGRLPDNIPFPDQNFDLIALLDVVEHVEDDQATLDALYARLKPGGYLLVTVPAFQWLFSHHDIINHHFRRYSKQEILEKLDKAKFDICFVNYWNVLFFPLAVAIRLYESIRPPKKKPIGYSIPPKLLNDILIGLVAIENLVNRFLPLPFGMSLVLLARKPER